jgi:hypothetical protein
VNSIVTGTITGLMCLIFEAKMAEIEARLVGMVQSTKRKFIKFSQ